MNFIKKFFNDKKIFSKTEKIFPQKKSLSKTIFKYFLYIFSAIIITFLIFLYSVLWDFKKFFFNIPQLTWFFREKNYLVLMLNNSEIRPWWWFISSFAEVKFFLWIPTIKIKNSYDIWNPNPLIEPPYPYNKILSEDVKNYKWWVFRDWNLSPDFPTNAKNISSLYMKWKNNTLDKREVAKFNW